MRLFRHHHSHNSGFTLIELLVVIAIIAILAVVVVLVLNPAQMLAQSRDANRLSDASTLVNALTYFSEDTNGRMGTSSVIYTSIPDPAATTTAGNQCQSIGLPSLASSTYNCPASSTFRLGNGTGWIPLDFSRVSYGTPLNSIPVDPENSSTTGNYYTYTTNGKTFEVTMAFESLKYAPIEANDGGQYADLYEAGSNLGLMQSDLFALKNPYAVFFESPKTAAGSSAATYTFSGTAGQVVSIGITGINSCYTNYTIYNPDGSTLVSGSTCSSIIVFSNKTLPADGTYKININPNTAYSNTITITDPITGTVPFETPTTINSPYVGQNAVYTFSGTAGELMSIALSGINSCYTYYYVYNPDGSTLASGSTCGSTLNFTNKTLPATGTYTIDAVPQSSPTLNTTVTLSGQLTGTIPFETPTAITSTYAGQTAKYTFSGTSGEIMDIGITGINSCYTQYAVYNPDGSTLASGTTCSSVLVFQNKTLPATGTYTFTATPANSAELNNTVSLSDEITGTIPFGTPTAVHGSYTAQTGAFTFSGTTGQVVKLSITGINSCYNYYYIYNPDGSTLTSGSTCASSLTLGSSTLPANGTYTIAVIPETGAIFNNTMTLTSG